MIRVQNKIYVNLIIINIKKYLNLSDLAKIMFKIQLARI